MGKVNCGCWYSIGKVCCWSESSWIRSWLNLGLMWLKCRIGVGPVRVKSVVGVALLRV